MLNHIPELANFTENLFKSFDTETYNSEVYKSTQYYGDVENNHKLFNLDYHGQTILLTFKPCKNDETRSETKEWRENERLEIEKKFNFYYRVHFYDQLDSNALQIGYTTISKFSIYFLANTLDDSLLRLDWNFNSIDDKQEIESLVKSLFTILNETQVFTQKDFFIELEKKNIRCPDSGWTN